MLVLIALKSYLVKTNIKYHTNRYRSLPVISATIQGANLVCGRRGGEQRTKGR